MKVFSRKELKKLYRPKQDSSKEDNGQIVIIGGSSLFHGAPLLALKAASRIVDMVFFASPEKILENTASDLKSKLFSFIWIPWKEVGDYIKKSDAILIGPGFLRYKKESQKRLCEEKGLCGPEGEKTRKLTISLFKKFPDKKWVVDAGSLQTMSAKDLPKNAIITPNRKEFNLIFRGEAEITKESTDKKRAETILRLSQKYNIFIVLKGPVTLVSSPKEVIAVKGGNAGLTKGGTGDILAGVTAALYAKNDGLLSASSASYLVKKAADTLYKERGFVYNADDLAEKIAEVVGKYLK